MRIQRLFLASLFLVVAQGALADFASNVMRADAERALAEAGYGKEQIKAFRTLGFAMAVHVKCGEDVLSASDLQAMANVISLKNDFPRKVVMERSLVFAKIEADTLGSDLELVAACREFKRAASQKK